MGKSLRDIDPGLPGGTIEFQEGFLKSKPIPGAEDCFISGRFDVLTKLDDGSFGVIDFKITKPDVEQIQKFSSQLHAYKFALENPAVGMPIKISQIGLISVSPDSIEHKDGKFVFTTSPTWHPIIENMEGFFGLIKEISAVLNGPVPALNDTCLLCAYREKFNNKKEVIQEDLPF